MIDEESIHRLLEGDGLSLPRRHGQDKTVDAPAMNSDALEAIFEQAHHREPPAQARAHLRELPKPDELSGVQAPVGTNDEAELLPENIQELSVDDVIERGPAELSTYDGDPALDDVPPPAPLLPAHVEQGLLLTGSLLVWPLPDVVRHILDRAQACVLTLELAEERLSLYSDGAFLVWAELADGDRVPPLAQLFAQCGLIDAMQLPEYLSLSEQALTALVYEKHPPEQVLEALNWHVAQLLDRAATAHDARFTLHGQLETEHISLLEKRPRVALKFVSRLFDFYRREPSALLPRATRAGMRYRCTSVFPLYDGLILSEEEKWVLDTLLEARSLDGFLEYAADEGYDPDTMRLVFERLLQFGLLSQLMRS